MLKWNLTTTWWCLSYWQGHMVQTFLDITSTGLNICHTYQDNWEYICKQEFYFICLFNQDDISFQTILCIQNGGLIFQIGVQYFLESIKFTLIFFESVYQDWWYQLSDPVFSLPLFSHFFSLNLKNIVEGIITVTNYPSWPWVQPLILLDASMVMMVGSVLTSLAQQ